MINFVNTGADEAILKSMSTEGCSEDLIKAMNKQGLVQKDVTVQGKNGKTFTRKQWVKASDVSAPQSSPHISNVNNGVWKKPSKIGSVFGVIAYNGNNIPESLSNFAFGFTERMRQTKFPHIKNTGNQDSIRALKEIISKSNWSAQGVCDALNQSRIGETNWRVVSETNDIIKIQCTDYNGNKSTMVVTPREAPHKTDDQISSDEKRLKDYKTGESIYVKYNGEWKKATKKLRYGNPYWEGLPVSLNNKGVAQLEWSDTLPSTSKPSTSKPSTSLDVAQFESLKADKAEALKYLKNCGVQWTENSHAGINWMRAMQAYNAAVGNQNTTKTTPTQPTSQPAPQTAQVAQNPQGKGGQKLSKEDAKKMTQSFTSKVGKTEAERKAFMDKVKAQGITWKDKADDGSDVASAVNWMRCCMAMNKHFAEGGSFDDSVATVKSPVPKTLADAGIDYGYSPSDSERTAVLLGAGNYQDVQDKVVAYVKQAALDFNDPNIKPNVSFIMDNVIEVGLGWSKDFKTSNRYDLNRSDGAAFKKQIESHISDMKFNVLQSGKKVRDGQTTFWFRLGN